MSKELNINILDRRTYQNIKTKNEHTFIVLKKTNI